MRCLAGGSPDGTVSNFYLDSLQVSKQHLPYGAQEQEDAFLLPCGGRAQAQGWGPSV